MRTLVVLLSETRSHELTYENIKANVIDELGADLCLCIGVKSNYDYNNPFYRLAKHKFLYHEPADDPYFQKALEYAYRCTISPSEANTYEKLEGINCLHGKTPIISIEKMGRSAEEIINSQLMEYKDIDCYVDDGIYLHAIAEKDNSNFVVSDNHTTYKRRLHYRDFGELKHRIGDIENNTQFLLSTGIHIFFTWFLWKNIKEYGLHEQYDRFVITRSDFIYQLPHPKLELLTPECIWIPDGENHHGICDRHAVLSPENIEQYLDIVSPLFKKSNEYYAKIQGKAYAHISWNMEQILKMNIEKNKVLHKVMTFPYVMYCVRPINGTTLWASGTYSENHGYFIKYPNEYNRSSFLKSEFDNMCVDINTFYKMYGWL